MPSEESKRVRAAGYARVSTEDQAKTGISLDDQERRIREFVAEQGWELVGVFRDEGVSGSIPVSERPAGAQALEAGADRIVIDTWDRLSRDAADFLAVVRDHNVVSITEDGEADLVRNIKAVIAEEERRKIRERGRKAAFALAREGRYNGPPLCGYRFDNKRLEPDPDTAPIAERIYREFVSGRRRKPIAAALNTDGVPTARGGSWTPATVTTILTHPVYVGKVADPDGNLFDGLHEPIISKRLWNQAQALVKAQATRRGKGRGRPPKKDYLLWGLLKCGECGAAMVPRTARGKGGKRTSEWYTCNSYIQFGADSPCGMRSIRRTDIDEAVWSFFERVGIDRDATLAHLREAHEHRLEDLRSRRQQAERALIGKRAALDRFDRDYEAGELSAANYERQVERVSEEQQALRNEAERLRASEAEAERDSSLIDVDSELVKLMATFRQVAVGEVRGSDVAGSDGMAAARATLTRLFKEFVVQPPQDGRSEVQPVARFEALEFKQDEQPSEDGLTRARPVGLRRVSLSVPVTKGGSRRPSS